MGCKHRKVARKILLEGGWTQKRLFDIGWSVSVNVKLARRRKAQRSTGSTLPRMVRSQTGDSRGLQKVGAKSKNLKERAEVAKRCC